MDAKVTKERPVLFSAPMIRVILAGTKTQTRRIVKPRKDRIWGCELAAHELAGEANNGNYDNSPYAPGDRLWCREAWRGHQSYDDKPPRDIPAGSVMLFEADGDKDKFCWHGKLRPSMFMPRWASRITLEISEVRVQRLQDISEADSLAEGISGELLHRAHGYPPDAYRMLWEDINGPGSWNANPWVWCVSFSPTRKDGRVTGGMR